MLNATMNDTYVGVNHVILEGEVNLKLICLELHKKVTNSSPKCNWDCKWEGIWNAVKKWMLSKVDSRVQMDAKSG